LAVFAAGCSQEKPQPVQTAAMRQEMIEDSRYMARLYQQWVTTHEAGDQMPINFSDEVQYRFVLNRLRAAGNTPENSPHLFAQVEKARARTVAAKPGTQTAALTTKEWCGHRVPFTESRNGGNTTFTQHGLITCFGGSEYAYVDVNVFSTDPQRTQFTLLASNANEDYGTKVLESAPLAADIPTDPNRELYVDSMAMAFDDTRGLSSTTYAQAETRALFGKPQLTIEHPTELIGNAFPNDNPIRSCLERGAALGNLDCDYSSANKDPNTGVVSGFRQPYTGVAAVDPVASGNGKWKPGQYWPAVGGYTLDKLYLPMKGWFSPGALGNNTDICHVSDSGFDVAKTKASIILVEQGGLCKSTAPGSTVTSAGLPWLPATLGTNVRSFNGLVDFGPDCLGYQQNVRLLVTVTSRATCGNASNVLRSATVNVQTLDFKNSCLAAGTQIARADGTSAPVEQIKVGEKVIANGRGLALTVTSVIEGIESRKKMIRLRDARGRDVLVTEKHPMLRDDGTVLAADALVAGDTVLARDGATRLVSVEREAYKGQVYNLVLGTEQELAKVGNQERTMFANGFLVGDNHMQMELERQSSRKPEDVLASLSKAWHQDYRNDLTRKASTRR
jgi:hypothetical protein